MKVRYLIYVAGLLIIAMLLSCSMPMKIIDDNTYIFMFNKPEQKLIIKSNERLKIVHESKPYEHEYRIETYKIAPPSLMEIENSLAPAKGIKNGIIISALLFGITYSIVAKTWTPIQIMGGLTAIYYANKWLNKQKLIKNNCIESSL